MKNIILLIILSVLLHTNQFAQDTLSDSSLTYTLDELKEYAVEHNYEIKNAELDIKNSKAVKWETTAIGLPQVSGQVNFQSFPLIPTTLLPGEVFGTSGQIPVQFGSKHNADWGVTVSQLVFSGEYIVGLRASKIYLELSKKAKKRSIISVKENIEKTYYLILISNESISVLDSVYDTTKSLLAENKLMMEAGFLEETDVEQLQLNLKSTENSLISFQKQREILYRLLKFQSGMDYSIDLKITGKLDTVISEIEESNLFMEDFSLNQNIDYQLMQVQENLADLSLQREKTNYLPSLSAFYSYQQSFMNDSLNFFEENAPWFGTSVWGLQLKIPIFSSGMRYSKVKQAQFELEKKQNQKSQTEQALMLETEQTKSDILISLNKVRNNSEQRHLAKKIYDNSYQKFKTGTEQSFILTQYQTQYFVSLTNYYQALNELIDKHITLKRLMNQL